MGAAGLDTTGSLVDGYNWRTYDFVIVDDRDKSLVLPDGIKALGKVGNVTWLKQCLVSRFQRGTLGS